MVEGVTVYSEEESVESLYLEIETIQKWECPLCSEEFTSDDGMTELEFRNFLVETKEVRKAHNEHMIGTFCHNCLSQADFKDWSG